MKMRMRAIRERACGCVDVDRGQGREPGREQSSGSSGGSGSCIERG